MKHATITGKGRGFLVSLVVLEEGCFSFQVNVVIEE
jgi:hypothetical protein